MKSLFSTKTFWVNLLMAILTILDMQYFGNLVPESIKAIIVLGVNMVLRLLTNQPVTLAGGKG